MSESSTLPDLAEVDITPLGRALSQLELAVKASAENPEDAFIRDAVIQRFEFTYELSVRMLRRYLRSIASSDDEVNEMNFKDMIRRASDMRLLHGGISEWAAFRQARTDTVHTYNEMRATEVASSAKGFAVEARALFENLSRRLSQ